jgi:hypothetical protein
LLAMQGLTRRPRFRSRWWATDRFGSSSPTERPGLARRPRTACCSTVTRRRVTRSSSRQRPARSASTTPMDRCVNRSGRVRPSGRGVASDCPAAASTARCRPTNRDAHHLSRPIAREREGWRERQGSRAPINRRCRPSPRLPYRKQTGDARHRSRRWLHHPRPHTSRIPDLRRRSRSCT